MTVALKTALREACAELREHMTPDWQAYTSLKQIAEWERMADDADLVDLAQEPRIELTDEALAAMLGVPVAMVAPYRCPGHGDRCRGATCCCADLHEPDHPPLPVDRDIKAVPVTRTAADISAEIYGMPPYKGPKVRHGPGGTGRPGPCDEDCLKCELEAEIAALEEAQEQLEHLRDEPDDVPIVSLSPPDPVPAEVWTERDRLLGDHGRENLGMPAHLLGVAPSDGIPALEQLQRIVRAQYRPPALPPPGHAMLCCARLGSVWCTEPHKHAGACKGPEERELSRNDFGKGRKL